MEYRAFVLLAGAPDREGVLERAALELAREFSGRGRVERTSDGFDLAIGSGVLRATYADAPHVRVENAELVELFGPARPDAAVLRSAPARLELSFGPDDPGMEHFTDYLMACESLERIEPAVAVDMAGPEFMSGKVLPPTAT